MNSTHGIPDDVRNSLVNAADALLKDFWPDTTTMTIHGTAWGLQELRCHQPNGTVFVTNAEQTYGEPGLDPSFVDRWEAIESEFAGLAEAVSSSFEEPEPWLALTGLPSEPRLEWRVTTVTPIDYDVYRALPIEPEAQSISPGTNGPPSAALEDGKITAAQADLQLAQHYQLLEQCWDTLASAARAIAECRGLQPVTVAFDSYLAEGETFVIREDFSCTTTDGSEVTISIEDTAEPREKPLWQQLESSRLEIELNITPTVHGRLTSADDLKGDESDIRICLFADYSPDGTFQHDDKGLKTIIDGTWL